MNPLLIGSASGLGCSLGLLLLASGWRRRRPSLIARVEPYVRRRSTSSGLLQPAASVGERTFTAMLLSLIASAAGLLEAIGSSADSVRRRLARLGGDMTYDEFRLQQLVWAVGALAATAGAGLAVMLVRHVSVPLVLIACLVAGVGGASARDWWLSRAVQQRQGHIESQLPDVVELLALAVGAGQGPVSAIEKVVSIGRGALVEELGLTLSEVRSGTILTTALAHLEGRVGSLQVTRLCEAISVALERGTPLAEVLRSQATDAREASRRALMEEGGRREIAQMVPVVFLVLPITVVFALFPGLTVLRIGL